MSGDEIIGARALREWITGERHHYSRVFFVDRDAPAHQVLAAAERRDAVFLPDGSEPCDTHAEVIRYGGGWDDIGDELFLGPHGVERQDYIAAAFVQIVGPIAVGFSDETSWRAFLDDAELARRTGVFPAALLDARVLLADRVALASPVALMRPSAVRVRSDGRVSAGMQGEVVGAVTELPSLLAAALPGAALVGGVMPRDRVLDDLRTRGWVGRYLTALELMRTLSLASTDAAIAGFGWTPFDDGLCDAEPRTADPLLLETGNGFLLADLTTRRRQLLSPDTARVVAVTQTSSDTESAAARVARQLEVPKSQALSLCLEAIDALGVHCGRRAVDSSSTTGAVR